ncbi:MULTISPECIES: serine hydrolase [Pseudidiomarina]|uniref:CubicO group peptidase (Beta-lactamase class C family) n=2 Tax=Pseudidiomarina TaxID=2800384 RepID=A0A368UW12_9GAMM|nr:MULTISPECIES: serine hydrolase [Pseudidiomarina]PWW13669.1 CubicO group peptidase (beta-lactamase class C family) [Pseudidiomarina maritima]RBP91063.1 CubicO group peptidase (beta-lactamase class C family) [Pseudidiomarina tainanensis]RCW33077.1 CubicO group peptidase (beta-lactamase class C family) [Pseudidiomarina tainanensis]
MKQMSVVKLSQQLKPTVLALALLMMPSLSSYAQATDTLVNTAVEAEKPALAEHIRASAAASLPAFNVPGMAVVAVHQGKVVLAEGFGIRDLESQLPVTKETLFGVASHTKAFTAAAMATLVDQGKVSWDDPVVKHLPEFKLADAQLSAQLTLRDLLSHRTGLGLGAGDLMIWPNTDKTTADLLAGLAHVPIAHGLRERFDYNNLMFIVAGEVIARVSGMSYADYLAETFFNPLNMNNTHVGFSTIPATNKNFAVGTIEAQGQLHRFALDYLEDFGAAGAIASNAEDFAQWLLTLLNHGVSPTGEQLISERSFQAMWQVTTPLGVPPAAAAQGTHFRGYGLGWFVKNYHGVKHVSHSGGILGMLSLTTLIPEHDFAITVISNQQAFGALTAVTEEALELILDLPDKDWLASEQAKYDDMIQAKAEFTLPAPSRTRAALDLASYSGTYRDAWYGDVNISVNDDQLAISFAHTPMLQGQLEHYSGDTFVIRWHEPLLEADAFIDFSVNREQQVTGARLEAVADFTDFSFDFHNLRLIRQ